MSYEVIIVNIACIALVVIGYDTITNYLQRNKKVDDVHLPSTLGRILLIPPILSVLLFSLNLLDQLIDLGFQSKSNEILNLSDFGSNWTGYGEGSSSSLPLYFGLMAIAGALLLKKSR